MIRVGIFGRGRLGSAIAQALEGAQDIQLVWHIDQGEAPSAPVEVAVAASAAPAIEGHLQWALESGSNLVIGATGWEIPDLAQRVGERIGVLVAPNFSLTVALMGRLATVLGRFAQLDPDLDPYLLEHHHRMKADAPGGTATYLADSVLKGCPRKSSWTMDPNPAPEQLHVSVIRAGAQFGEHTVGLDGSAETLKLTHTARSRALFGRGAVHAIRWAAGRKGLYSFNDFARGVLNPLFDFGDLS
nr:dihydrodipicolinate reductase C-terminal domain-containing protein [uncultured Holophaga sp.]